MINIRKNITDEVINNLEFPSRCMAIMINEGCKDLGERSGRSLMSPLERIPEYETFGSGEKSPQAHDFKWTYSRDRSERQEGLPGIDIGISRSFDLNLCCAVKTVWSSRMIASKIDLAIES